MGWSERPNRLEINERAKTPIRFSTQGILLRRKAERTGEKTQRYDIDRQRTRYSRHNVSPESMAPPNGLSKTKI